MWLIDKLLRKLRPAMSDTKIFGQWIGNFEGDCKQSGQPKYVFPGRAIFNIERDRPSRAFACIDQGNAIHGSRKNFDIKVEGNRIVGQSTGTSAFDFEKNEMISIEESTKRQALSGKDIFYVTDVHIVGTIDSQAVNCIWSGKHKGEEMTGKFSGVKLRQEKTSEADRVMHWPEFKAFISETIKNGDEFLFRGQSSNKFRLSTSFHRENRYDLLRYENEDCAALIQHVNALSSRQYDLRNPFDFGALLSLVQHHGFPTPLLDWSRSPYVAAFFAFRDRQIATNSDGYARIYMFDEKIWRHDTTQVWHIEDPRPTISPREFPAHSNPRHLPQQSVHTYTNVEDPEAWIRLVERANKKRYLTIIDIPRTERKAAMRDLAYMNVTAASLFPGLEGACSSLKERFFHLPE